MLLALKMEESTNDPKDVGSCRKLEKAKTNQNKKTNKQTNKQKNQFLSLKPQKMQVWDPFLNFFPPKLLR